MTKWHDDDHLDRSINAVFDKMVSRFFKAAKDEDNDDRLVSLSAQIGYLAQVKIGMEKTINIKQEINSIKAYLRRIPPEIIADLNQPATMEEDAQLV